MSQPDPVDDINGTEINCEIVLTICYCFVCFLATLLSVEFVHITTLAISVYDQRDHVIRVRPRELFT